MVNVYFTLLVDSDGMTSRDRLRSLRRCAGRWGLKAYRVRASPDSLCGQTCDRSDESLHVLKRVDVIRADIQHIASELPEVRATLPTLLVAVDSYDKLKLQEHLGRLCDRAKRAQLLLCSMTSLGQEEIPDSPLVRILNCQQTSLCQNLLDIVEQLKDCEEELAATLRKRQSRTASLHIITDCVVLPLPLRRWKSVTASPFESNSPYKSDDVMEVHKQKSDVTVERQLVDLCQVSSSIIQLLSDQNGLFNNIEHNMKAQSMLA